GSATFVALTVLASNAPLGRRTLSVTAVSRSTLVAPLAGVLLTTDGLDVAAATNIARGTAAVCPVTLTDSSIRRSSVSTAAARTIPFRLFPVLMVLIGILL